MDKNLKFILDRIPVDLSAYFADKRVTEIRLRRNSNIRLCTDGRCITVDNSLLTAKQTEELFMSFCGYTLSVYRSQIARGFITLPGGHRIGIGGRFDNSDNELKLVSISSMVIRVASDAVYSFDGSILDFKNGLLVAGPPHSGKTTLLKTICRNINMNTVVCDERNEFYSEKTGCDLISGINKTDAIAQAVRCLNPEIIICDEIGSENEARQLLSFMNTGVKFICSVHADTVDRLWLKPNIKILLDNRVFDKIAVLATENNRYFVREIVNV